MWTLLDYAMLGDCVMDVTEHYIAAFVGILRCEGCAKVWICKLDGPLDHALARDLLEHSREKRAKGCR